MNPQRETSLTPRQTEGSVSVPWPDALAELLVRGLNRGEAIAEIVAAGVDQAEATALATHMLSHPLFKVARASWVRLQCRDWFLGVLAALGDHDNRFREIDTSNSISRSDFLCDYYWANRPLRLEGIATEWPAVHKWNRQYLIDVCGDEEIEVMMNRSRVSIGQQNTSPALQQAMLFRDYVNLVYDGGPSNDYYLVSRNRFFERPKTRRLLQDVLPLPFVDTQGGMDGVKLWFGPAGTLTPLHYDDRNNVVIQILGRKRVRLYAPCFGEFMYQVQHWYAAIDPRDLDLPADKMGPPEIRLTLTPGDALFIPVGWWHAVEADEISITMACVSFGVPNSYDRRDVTPTSGRRAGGQ